MNKKYLDNKYIRLLVMSLIIIAALIFVQDFADFLDESSDRVIKLGVNQHCNSASSICSASQVSEGEFQRISFTISEAVAEETLANQSIVNKPAFAVKITAVGFDFDGIESVSVLFEIPGEVIENKLIALNPDKSMQQVVPENWHAIINLPEVENMRRKGWLAVVYLKSTKREYRAEYPFLF